MFKLIGIGKCKQMGVVRGGGAVTNYSLQRHIIREARLTVGGG